MEVFGNERCRIGPGESVLVTHSTTISIPGLETIVKKTRTEVRIQSIVDKDGNAVIGGKATFSVIVQGGE
jgi:hypothetical protein